MTVAPPSQSEAFDHGLSTRGLWILMGTIAGMTAFAPFATDVYLPAFPNLTDDLHATDSAAQLTLTATFLGIMIGQLVFGPMSDSIGRRRLVITMTLATIASTIACTLAPTIEFLTFARLALGVTGGAGIVIGRAIAADISKGPEAARFFSLLMSITMLAPLIGPVVGGALLTWTQTWRAAFIFLTGFVVLLALAIIFFVPETLPPDRRHSGGLRELGRGAGLMFRDRVFMGYAITQVFAFATLFAYLASSSFVFQETFGLSPSAYSFAFSGIVLSILFVGMLNRRLLLNFAVRRLLVVSLAIATIAAFVLIPIMAVSSPSMWLMIFVLLFVMGTRASIGANAMALALERSAFVGTASAIIGAMTFAGALVATPLLAILPFNTGLTMAVVMAICSVLSLLCTILLARESVSSVPATS
ncbi:MAG: multidrug effflux MFS transporter [Actinomycetota bacterium]|nr:multidrug effflux MFS transporter [Actinomycetota bacterium]